MSKMRLGPRWNNKNRPVWALTPLEIDSLHQGRNDFDYLGDVEDQLAFQAQRIGGWLRSRAKRYSGRTGAQRALLEAADELELGS